MSSPNQILLAILALDSYNRGYNQQLYVSGTDIGGAVFQSTSDADPNSVDVLAGFSASAYSFDGDTVISYRGTDDITGGGDGGGSDLLNGWTIGAGYSAASQALLAEQFYSTVTGQGVFSGTAPANVILTGHSLGGGLAGFIATLTGTQAAIFDNMPFGAAVAAATVTQNASIGWQNLVNLFEGEPV